MAADPRGSLGFGSAAEPADLRLASATDPAEVYFNDRILGRFTPDLLINGVVIVEVKALRAIDGAHRAQVINYLKASNIEVALLLNFGDTPQFQRFAFDNTRKTARKPPQELDLVESLAGTLPENRGSEAIPPENS